MASEHTPIVIEHAAEELQVCHDCLDDGMEVDAAVWPCAGRQLEERLLVAAFGFDVAESGS